MVVAGMDWYIREGQWELRKGWKPEGLSGSINSKILPEYGKGWASNPGLNYRSIRTPKKIEFSILAGLLYKSPTPYLERSEVLDRDIWVETLENLKSLHSPGPWAFIFFSKSHFKYCRDTGMLRDIIDNVERIFPCTNDICMSSPPFSPVSLYSPCIYPVFLQSSS